MKAGIKDYYKSNKHTNKQRNKQTNTNKPEQSVSMLHKYSQRKGSRIITNQTNTQTNKETKKQTQTNQNSQ
jgi:hypothetical protein